MFPGSFSAHRFLLLLSLAGICLVVLTGNVRYTSSDPQLTLLTSQAILEQGNTRLDTYKYAVSEEQFSDGEWKYYKRGGSYYYFYPLGTSVLSLPFVAVARKLGMDMTIRADDVQLQIFISALLCVFIAFLVYRLARRFTGEWPALCWMLVLFFGSSWISSLGTALWSFGFETVFILLTLTDLVDAEKEGKAIKPVRTGFFLFLAWFCRPAALSFILIVLAWLLYRKKFRPLLFLLPAFLVPFGVLVLFSSLTFGEFVPPYYNIFRWAGADLQHGMFYRFASTLFSPARGLFVYTPLLLLAFGGFFFAGLRKNKLFLLAWAWIGLHLLMLARHTGWWGGWCYGPRLATDILPAFALLIFMLLPELEKMHPSKSVKLGSVAVILLAFFGIYVHTVQGVYNKETYNWNDFPNVDEQTDFYAWNWRYPQFMASTSMNNLKKREAEWLRELPFLSREMPEGSALLAAKPDAELRYIFNALNRNKAAFGNIELFNNLYELNRVPRKSFYIMNDQLSLVSQSPYYRVMPDSGGISLGDYLATKENQLVMLVVKDEGSSALSPGTRSYLRNKGAHTDSLKYRQGYILVIDHGKLKQEIFDQGEGARLLLSLPGGKEAELLSLGMDKGNRSSIRIGKEEYSMDLRGCNLVVLDDKGIVTDVLNFDTHKSDHRTRRLTRVELLQPAAK